LPFPTNPRRRVLRSEPFLEAPGSLLNPEDQRMDANRVEGTMKNVSGKVEEGVGRITGNARTRAEGVAKQAAGTAQDLYGQTADAARETALTFEKWLRNTIETQPYTSAAIALGVGWLLGRMHRPL